QSRLEQSEAEKQNLQEQLQHLQNAQPVATLETLEPFSLSDADVGRIKDAVKQALAEHTIAGQVEEAPKEYSFASWAEVSCSILYSMPRPSIQSRTHVLRMNWTVLRASSIARSWAGVTRSLSSRMSTNTSLAFPLLR